MKKEELILEVQKLIKENKTEKALKLLSGAQLSDLDKLVISLNQQYTSAKHDWITDSASKDEINRRYNRINRAILDLVENVETNFAQNNPEKTSYSENHQIRSFLNNDITDRSRPIENVKEVSNNKKWLWGLLLVIPIALLVVWSRTPKQEEFKKPVKINIEELKRNKTPWNLFQILYQEDFSNRQAKDHRGDIWTLSEQKDYEMGVNDENATYKIKVLKKGLTRHKYLGRMKYDMNTESVPVSATVTVANDLSCSSRKNCLGRGVTINYNSKKNSAYALLLNDSGDINFVRFGNVFQPDNGEVLFSEHKNVKAGGRYDLGVVEMNNKFFLYFEGTLIDVVEDHNFKGEFCGIIASGEGTHIFNEVRVFEGL